MFDLLTMGSGSSGSGNLHLFDDSPVPSPGVKRKLDSSGMLLFIDIVVGLKLFLFSSYVCIES